jgi:hypothetical protein
MEGATFIHPARPKCVRLQTKISRSVVGKRQGPIGYLEGCCRGNHHIKPWAATGLRGQAATKAHELNRGVSFRIDGMSVQIGFFLKISHVRRPSSGLHSSRKRSRHLWILAMMYISYATVNRKASSYSSIMS